MPGLLYNYGATVLCFHGGQVTAVPTSTRVLLGGSPIVLVTDQCMVAGCPMPTPPAGTSPCVSIQWNTPATRVQVEGKPPLLQTSVGLCLNAAQAPQGTAVVVAFQSRVTGV